LETFIWRGFIKLIKSDSDYITISNTVSGVLLTFFIQEPWKYHSFHKNIKQHNCFLHW